MADGEGDSTADRVKTGVKFVLVLGVGFVLLFLAVFMFSWRGSTTLAADTAGGAALQRQDTSRAASKTLTLLITDWSQVYPADQQAFAGTYVLQSLPTGFMAWVQSPGALEADRTATTRMLVWNQEKQQFDMLMPGKVRDARGYITQQDKVYMLSNSGVFVQCTGCSVQGSRVIDGKPLTA